MSLTLTTVAGNGGPLSSTQNDANMNAIMTEVNATEATLAASNTTLASTVSQTALNAMFAGVSGGQQQINWGNIIGMPARNVYPFRMSQTGSNQQLTVTGGTAFNATVTLNNIIFDVNSICNTTASTATLPVTGNWMLNGSVERDLVSGAPGSPIGMNFIMQRNGAEIFRSTVDLNANTGTCVWRINELINATAGDVISLSINIVQPSNSVWEIQAQPNTSLSGFLVI